MARRPQGPAPARARAKRTRQVAGVRRVQVARPAAQTAAQRRQDRPPTWRVELDRTRVRPDRALQSPTRVALRQTRWRPLPPVVLRTRRPPKPVRPVTRVR